MTSGTSGNEPARSERAGDSGAEGKHGRGKIIESFAPTGGRVLGIIVLVIALAALVDIVVEWRTLDGLTAAAVIVGLGTLVWMSMVRPGIALYDNALVMRNFVRDVQIPWHLITDAEIKPILTVTADGRTYRSVAIAATGADRRALWKARAGGDGSGLGNPGGAAGGSAPPPGGDLPHRPALHAAHRVRVVAEKNADRSRAAFGSTSASGEAPGSGEASGDSSPVRWFWAWPELVVLGVAALVALVTLLVA